MSVDVLAIKFSNDVVDYIRNWMRGARAEDLDFHKYRMRLLLSLSEASTTMEKLVLLLDKTSSRIKFAVLEALSDKGLGEAISKYIFARLMIALNEEYRKILDHESDRVKSEIYILLERSSGLKTKIGHH
jgi:hypothetical protein